jgi:hypothetical protein
LEGRFNFSEGKNIKPNEVEKGKQEGDFKNNLKAMRMKYVDLINGVNYIMPLEYGYSKQAPAGMVRISMMKMRKVLPDMLDAQFLHEWNKLEF